MPTPSRGAATNRPDTSYQNVARVLREYAEHLDLTVRDDGPENEANYQMVAALAAALEQRATGRAMTYNYSNGWTHTTRALADALEQRDAQRPHSKFCRCGDPACSEPAAPTWDARIQRVSADIQNNLIRRGVSLNKARASEVDWLYAVSEALRTSFPELAPSDD